MAWFNLNISSCVCVCVCAMCVCVSQEDCDMAWFNLDIKPIQERCAERGDIKHVRFPIRDFDPYDLRRKLPRAISRLTREHDPEKGGTIYIHCTAGESQRACVCVCHCVCTCVSWTSCVREP